MAGPDSPSRPSYPPPGQILSALGIEVSRRNGETMEGRVLVDPVWLGRGGRPAGVGALVPIVDLVAGVQAGQLAAEDWLATSDVWLHQRAPVEGGPILVVTRLARAGKRVTVITAEVSAAGRPVVTASIEFARIRREASGHSVAGSDATGGWSRLGSGPLLDRPVETACGFRVIDPTAGVVEVDQTPFVANSTGTLQGGVAALLADAAAASTVGPDARTIDLQYRFLAPTGRGPAQTRAEPIRTDGRNRLIRVEVIDAADRRLVGLAICCVRSP